MTTVDVLTYVITGDVSQLQDSLSKVDVSSKKLLQDIQKNFKGLGADVESKVDAIVTQFVRAAHEIKEAAGKDMTFQEAIDSVQTLSKEFLKISDSIAPLVRGDIEAWSKTIIDSINSMKNPDTEAYYSALAAMWEKQKQVYSEREAVVMEDAAARERAADASIAAYDREKQALIEQGEEDEKRLQNYLRIQAQLKEAAEIRAAAEEEDRVRKELAAEQLKAKAAAEEALAEAEKKAAEEALRQKEIEDNAGHVIGVSTERVVEYSEKLKGLSEKYAELEKTITPVVEGTNAFTTALNSVTGVIGFEMSLDSIKSLVKDAGKAEKSLTRLSSVYKSSAATAEMSAKSIASSYGLSQRAAQEMLAYAGQVFTEQGFMADQALEMAENFVKRAVDLQSMTQGGADAASALKAMVSALISGTKALKSWGVAFTSQDVANMARIHNLESLNGKLEGSSKILAAYYTILDKTTEAEGDFAKNEENLVNVQQEYNAALEDLRAAIGESFLPLAKNLLQTVTGIAEFLGEHKWFTSFIATTMGGVVALRALSATVGLGAKAMTNLKIAVDSTTGALAAASAAATALNAALGVIAIAGVIASLIALTSAASNAAAASQAASSAVKEINESGALSSGSIKDLNKQWKTLNNEVKDYHEGYDSVEESAARAQKAYDNWQSAITKGKSKWRIDYLKDVYDDAKKYLDEVTNKERRATDVRAAFIMELARAYYDAGEDAGILAGLNSELITQIKEYTDRLKEAKAGGLDLDAYARTLSRTTADWNTLLEDAERHLDRVMGTANKATGDYNVILARSISLLKEQRKEYDDASYTQLDTIGKLNGLSENSRKLLRENAQAIVEGKKSVDEWADGITEDTKKINLDVISVLSALLNAEVWFNTESEAYRREFLNSVNKDAEKFTEYMTKLSDKSAVSLREQYDKTLNGGIETFKGALNAAYGASGGLNGILSHYLGVDAGGEDFPIDTFIDKLVEKVKNGAETANGMLLQLQEEGIDVLHYAVGTKQEDIDALNEFIENVKKAVNELIGFRNDATDTYTEGINKLLNDASAKQLRAASDNANVTLQIKRDNEKALLEAEQEADRKSYQQQLGANYEKEQAYKDLLSAQEVERNNLTDKWNREDADLLRTHNQTMLNFAASSAQGAQASYDAQIAIYAEEYQYRIDHAKETGEAVANINAEWSERNLEAYREYVSAMKSEMDNLRNIVIEGQKKANKEDLFTDIFSFENIGNIRDNLALTLEETIKGGLDKLTKENKQKYEEAVAEGKLNIADMIANGMSMEEIKAKLEELGLAGDEFEAVWSSICQDCADATEDANDAIIKAIEDSVDALMNYYSKVNDLIGAFSDNKKTDIQNTMAEYQKMYDQFSDSLQKRNEQNTEGLTKKEKDELERRKKMDEDEMARMQALIDEQETLLDEQKHKDFEREKAFSITEATIDGLKAAVKAYSSAANPVYGAVLAGISTAFTAAQIAAIASQPYPSYAVGAYELPQDQLAQVHKGEMIVPKPFAEEIRDNGGFGGEITVNLYGVGEGADVETSENADARQIDVYVSSKVRSMVARGELDGVLQSRYVLSRNGRRG